MDTNPRRQALLTMLTQENQPRSATTLAKEFQVSRQIIVGDIALLRASGHDILATPRGYLMASPPSGITGQVACLHTADQMALELYTIVDAGGEVVDVSVESPLYGQLTGTLHLRSRHDVDAFLEKSSSSGARPLSHLTDGVHLHTISCPDLATWNRILAQLSTLNLCYPQ